MEGVRVGELNPLENPVVLQIIFEHLSVRDLAACRKVSKTWLNCSLKSWRSSATPKIDSFSFSKRGVSVPEFLKFVGNKNSEYFQLPFTHVSLNQQNKKFWALCGSSIKYLTISSRVQFKCTNDFRNAIYNCCPNLVKLSLLDGWIFRGNKKVATLEPIEFEEPQFGQNMNLKSLVLSNFGKYSRISWMELLTHYPGLESISLNTIPLNDENFFRSINLIRRQDSRKLQIKHIYHYNVFKSNESPEFVNFLLDSTIELETLHISQTSVPQRQISLVNILSKHASTLKKLCIAGPYQGILRPHDSLDLASQRQFEKLGELELENLVFRSIILNLTPNLKRLALGKGCLETIKETDISKLVNVPLISCKELIMPLENPTINDLNKLMDMFPYLEKLEMRLNNETFRLVCTRWTKLRSIEISGVGIDDCGITGLDLKDVRRINKERREVASQWPITVRKANITCLKYLQSVLINEPFPFLNTGLRPVLGYCSAVCGFMENTNITQLCFRNCQLDKILWKYGVSCIPIITYYE